MSSQTAAIKLPGVRLAGTFFLCLLLCVLAARSAAAQVPAEFLGEWVPAAATCDSPARVRFEVAKITLVNGGDSESLAGIEMAGPAYFAPDYQGIMAVAITEFSGDQPVTATFNVQEKRGVAQVELASPTPGKAPNATVAALNARFTKLNLAKRFPLHAVLLKKCPARPAVSLRP